MPLVPLAGTDPLGSPSMGGPGLDPLTQQQQAPQAKKPILKGEQPQDMTMGDYVKDTALGAVGGVGKAINETSDLVYHGANWVDDNVLGDSLMPEDNPFLLPEYKPKSLAGDIAKGVTEFATGFVGAGKFMKAFKIAEELGQAGRMGAFAKSSIQGALADFVAFDPHEGRFSNMLQEMGVKNDFIDFLAASTEDSQALGRFKNAVEGLALGAVTEPLVMLAESIKGARTALKTGGPAAAERVMGEAAPSLEALLNGEAKHDYVPVKPGDEAIGQAVTLLDGGAPGTILGREADGTLKVKHLDADGNEVEALLREDQLLAKPDKATRFQPGEQVEVYSPNAQGDKVRTVAADEHGFVKLKEGERFVTERFNAKVRDVPVDTEKLARGVQEVLARQGTPEEVQHVVSDAINVEHLTDNNSVREIVAQIAEAMRPSWDDGVWKHADLLQDANTLAEQIGSTGGAVETLGRQLLGDASNVREATIRMVASKALVQKLTLETQLVAKRLAVNPSLDDQVLLKRLLENAGNLVDGIKQVGKEGARMTSAGNINTLPVGDIAGLSLKEKQAIIDAAGGERRLIQVAEKIANGGADPGAIMRMAKGTRFGQIMDIHNELWINSILSGPKTSMVNMTSNLVNTLVMPAQKIVGGVITGETGAVKEGLRLYTGLAMYIQDSLKMARQSMFMAEGEIAARGGNSILDAGKSSYDVAVQKVTARNLGLDDESMLGRAMNYLGTVARLPSRFLGAQDEFFKQLNYRAKAYSDLVAHAVDVKGITDKDGIAKYVAEEFGNMFDAAGGGTYEKALEAARYATFTKDLDYGFGKWMQSGGARFPAMRVIVPFIRTPVNIFRQAWQMTPILGRFQKQFAEDLASSDPVVKAAARGREALGGMLWTSAILAASTGKLTGGGPKDPALRERWLEAGNQPYSIVHTDEMGRKTFTQLSRIDPFAMCLGIAADYADAGKYLGEDDMGNLAASMATALTRNITSKSYLKGLIDVLQTVNDPNRFMEKYIQRQASTYVPFSGALGQVRQETDDSMREVRSVMDAMLNRVPGLSDKLPAKRSWVTGQPILTHDEDTSAIPDLLNPFAQKKAEDSRVLQELARLQHGISAPREAIGNIQLNSDQYSRYKELHGTLRLGNRTMMEALDRVMSTDKYDIERKRVPDGPDELTDHRMAAIKQVVEKYRNAAQLQLLREDPSLHQAYITDKRNVRLAKRGQYDQLQSMF